jgi:hypothetical protein
MKRHETVQDGARAPSASRARELVTAEWDLIWRFLLIEPAEPIEWKRLSGTAESRNAPELVVVGVGDGVRLSVGVEVRLLVGLGGGERERVGDAVGQKSVYVCVIANEAVAPTWHPDKVQCPESGNAPLNQQSVTVNFLATFLHVISGPPIVPEKMQLSTVKP